MSATAVPLHQNVTINPAGFSTPGLPNEGYRVWLALVIMIITSGMFVIARMATRIQAGQVGADDYAIVAALISCIVQTTLWALAVRLGYGAAYLKLDTWHRQQFNKWWFLGSIFYPLTIALFKTSVILLNKRIFVQRGFQILCWVILVINSCWALGNILGWTFMCIPIPIMWGVIPASKGRCFDLTGIWYSLTAWDVSTDVFILGMAIPMVWRLHMKVRERIMLTGIFFLGCVVIVFSIMSCSAIMTGLQKQSTKDQSNKYTFALANMFQVLESNMGIIGACLPILRQPLKQHLPSLFGSSKDSKGPSQYYTDDRFADQYAMQKLSNGSSKDRSKNWHDVSVSGPELFRSAPRKSDELGIIRETMDSGYGDSDKGSGQLESGRSMPQTRNGIRKHVVVSVDRK